MNFIEWFESLWNGAFNSDKTINNANQGQISATNHTQSPVVPVQTTSNQSEPIVPIKPLINPIPENFLHAIVMQESRGNVGAIGDLHIDEAHGGHAYGPMQIRQPVCDDVNKRFGCSLLAPQMLNNLELSEDTFIKYMHIYFPNGGTFEEMAMAWNGGGEYHLIYGKPGYDKYTADLDAYWKGVQEYL